MRARMWPAHRSEVEQLKENGLDDPEKKLTFDGLIEGDDVVFAATGVTSGETLGDVRHFRGEDPRRGDDRAVPYGKIRGHHPRPGARSGFEGSPTLKES